jgi:hypothetical protein
MSDKEFIEWAENKPLEFDENSMVIFEAYEKELERRKRIRKNWNGKVVIENGVFTRLKSYDQIFDEYDVSFELRNAIQRYMQFTVLNGRLMTNAQLEDLLFQLREVYGEDDTPKISLVDKALKFGWSGIIVPGYRS